MTRFLFLRIGPPQTDFRFALAEALHGLGHEVAYLYLGRRSILFDLGTNAKRTELARPEAIGWLLTRRSRQDFVFDATDLAFLEVMPWLKRWLGGFWIFDLHDDLRYGRGEAATAALGRHAAMHDLTVCAAPSLVELVPRARCLGNASNLRPSMAQNPSDRVLILASLDERFDFAFLAKAAGAAPGLAFDLYGHVAETESDTAPALSRLLADHPNIHHRGAYLTEHLANIIAGYKTMFSVFRTSHPTTRHIDPLRFRHALNAGLELITTDIPAGRLLSERLHITSEPAEIGPLVATLRKDPCARRNRGHPPLPDWTDRAAQLLALIHEHRSLR